MPCFIVYFISAIAEFQGQRLERKVDRVKERPSQHVLMQLSLKFSLFLFIMRSTVLDFDNDAI